MTTTGLKCWLRELSNKGRFHVAPVLDLTKVSKLVVLVQVSGHKWNVHAHIPAGRDWTHPDKLHEVCKEAPMVAVPSKIASASYRSSRLPGPCSRTPSIGLTVV